MMPDYPLGETLDFKFTTRAFATGVPTILTGSPAIEVYEDNDTMQITAGETLTANFDGVAGLNNLRIVATGANGYETGKSYSAVISAGTVGGVTVIGEVVAQFSIERSPALRPTTAGRTLDVTAAGEAGLDLDNTVGTLAATQFASNFLTAAKINAGALDGKGNWNIGKTGYSLTVAPLTAAQVNAEVDTALADINLDHFVGTASGIPALPAGTYLDLLQDDGTAVYNRTTDSLQAIRDRGDSDWITGGGGADKLVLQDTTILAITSQTEFTLVAGSTDNNAYLNCTIVIEDAATAVQKFSTVITTYVGASRTVTLREAPVFTIFATDKIYILAEQGLKTTLVNRQLDVTATGEAGLDLDNTVGTLAAAQFASNFLTAAKINAAALNGKGDWNVGKTGYSLTQAFPTNFAAIGITAGGRVDGDVLAINGSTLAAIQLALSAEQIEDGALEGTPSVSTLQTDLAETQDDIYIGRIIIMTSGAARGEATDIIDYTGATGTLEVTDLANQPSASDTFILI